MKMPTMSAGLLAPGPILRTLADHSVHLPDVEIPSGRLVELPGRGTTYVTDTPGPTPDAPAVVLLHALACTGLLTWFPTVGPLSQRLRVITLDQRWHGQGIRGREFSLYDCADDVAALLDVLELDRAIIAGYSMGSIIAQRMWRQHPERVQGLVLAASADRFQLAPYERLFFTGLLGPSMLAARGLARSRTTVRATRAAAQAVIDGPSDLHEWALREFRSTSPWAVGQALSALGQHHSRPWLKKIDVPTAVVVMTHDKVIPTSRQVHLSQQIPGATQHPAPGGHAGCVLNSDAFVPIFCDAVATTHARSRDFGRPGTPRVVPRA